MNRPIRLATLSVILALAMSAASASAGVIVKVIATPGELPEAFRPVGAAGDILISDGRYAALIAGSSRSIRNELNMAAPDPFGLLLAFAPSGASGRLWTLVGSPSLRVSGRAVAMRVVSVRPEGRLVVARWEGGTEDQGRFEVDTLYEFDFEAGQISIAAEVRNIGQKDVEKLSFGLGANFLQNLNFTPYNARAYPGLNFRVYQRPDHVLGWWNPNPEEAPDTPLPGLLQPGQAHRVSYALLAGKDIPDVLDRLYRIAQAKAGRQAIELRTAGTGTGSAPALGPGFETVEVLISEPATGAVFYRAFLNHPASLSVPLPDGTYRVRVNAFPAVREGVFRRPTVDAKGAEAAWLIEVRALGKVNVRLRDSKGSPVAGKVSFIGLTPAESPYFAPENPVNSGRGWESQKNSVYPGRDGEAVRLPEGTYLAVASRGPAYTRQTRVVEVFAGSSRNAGFVIDRVVATPGLVSVDPHMHTQFSDGRLKIAERLKGVAAEGVDVAVSADHNYLTDYRPELARLGLTGTLAVIVGSEVTGRGGNIHFNSYPLAPHPEAAANGAISVEDSTPGLLFDLTRKNNPAALVQVNHPRSRGLGYFLTYNLDQKAAEAADRPFVTNFDVMEAMNGAYLSEANRTAIEDWFHLLNRGYPVRIVGSSDAHGQDGGEPGYSRTYVLYGGAKGAGLDVPALVRSIKEGRSFVSNGPIVTARANGKWTYGDTLTARDGRLALDLEVRAAPWIDVSEIRLVVNGERQKPIAVGGQGAAGAVTRKYTGRTTLTLERDSWVAVEVKGRGSLFPTVQQRSRDGTAEGAPLPYALTNPIFVDVDGDGKITAVWPDRVAIR
jgi:hypothetical protein